MTSLNIQKICQKITIKWTKKLTEYKMIEPGDIIISSPYADTGIVFSKSVIYIISHDHTGTSGVIINKLIQNILFTDNRLNFSRNNICNTD